MYVHPISQSQLKPLPHNVHNIIFNYLAITWKRGTNYFSFLSSACIAYFAYMPILKIINNIFWGKNPSFSSDWIHDAHTAYGIQGLAAFAHTFSKNHLGLILLSIQKHTHILTAQFHGFGEQEWLLFSLTDSCRAIHSRKDRERLKLNMYMFWL